MTNYWLLTASGRTLKGWHDSTPERAAQRAADATGETIDATRPAPVGVYWARAEQVVG